VAQRRRPATSTKPHPRRRVRCDAGWVPDGVDVRPDTLRRGAADLRGDAGELDGARRTAGSAGQQVATAAGTGPLSGTAADLAAALEKVLDDVRHGLGDSADALDATASQYVITDADTASRLSDVPVPGFAPPG
jgi:hypothetical protein